MTELPPLEVKTLRQLREESLQDLKEEGYDSEDESKWVSLEILNARDKALAEKLNQWAKELECFHGKSCSARKDWPGEPCTCLSCDAYNEMLAVAESMEVKGND